MRGSSSKRGESGSRRPDSQKRADCVTNRNFIYFFNVYDYTNLKTISVPKQASQALKNKDTLRGLVSINEAKKSAPKNLVVVIKKYWFLIIF